MLLLNVHFLISKTGKTLFFLLLHRVILSVQAVKDCNSIYKLYISKRYKVKTKKLETWRPPVAI